MVESSSSKILINCTKHKQIQNYVAFKFRKVYWNEWFYKLVGMRNIFSLYSIWSCLSFCWTNYSFYLFLFFFPIAQIKQFKRTLDSRSFDCRVAFRFLYYLNKTGSCIEKCIFNCNKFFILYVGYLALNWISKILQDEMSISLTLI